MSEGLGTKTLLSVKDVADLKGCTEQNIRKLISDGKMEASEEICPDNRQKRYMIDLKSLAPALQKRYYKRLRAEGANTLLQTASQESASRVLSGSHERAQKAFDRYTAEEREQIVFWSGIIEEWQEHRQNFDRMTDADPLYVAALKLKHRGLDISTDILYRRLKSYNEGDLDGLIDKRGGWNKGKTSIDEEAWGEFVGHYLQEQQLPVTECYRLTKQWARLEKPELVAAFPSEQSFRRMIKTLPEPIIALGRRGQKYYDDNCVPYIERLYDELHANDYWVADGHTLDIMTRTEDGERIHRLTFSGYIDALSGVITGGVLTDNPSSQSTLYGLRNSIMRMDYSVPWGILVDNGREYLTYDVGGRGHRTRKRDDLVSDPPTILKRLGINMMNALPRNAKAKQIERTFGTLKNQFSRHFETFTGGNIMEKPESLKYTLKKGEIPLDGRLRDLIYDYIDIYNAQEYGGALRKYKGMTRMQVWNASIAEVGMRKTTPEDLNLMLMRSTRPQKVDKLGVYIAVSGGKLHYWDQETVNIHFGKEVYVRYDPAALASVRIYDAKTDEYIHTAPMAMDTTLLFVDSQENISTAQEKIRAAKKDNRNRLQELRTRVPPEKRLDEIYLMSCMAAESRTGTVVQTPKRIIPVYAGEEPLKKVSGGDAEGVIIDMEKWNRNLELRKRGGI